MASFPVLDISVAFRSDARLALETGSNPPEDLLRLSRELYTACSTWGAFEVINHNVTHEVMQNVQSEAQKFFALPLDQKLALHVSNGGLSWRGYMPMGGEQTHGRTDQKEGLYVGPEHEPDHPKFTTPVYGRNQFPDSALPSLRPAVLEYIEQTTELGHVMMALASLSLGLHPQHIRRNYTQDPLAIVRLFNYPPSTLPETLSAGDCAASPGNPKWGIGEHTDYGLWTMLKQFSPGLQFEHPDFGWVDVPFIPDSIVMNVGDVFDRMTGGRFKSRRHRARNLDSCDSRITIPYFFDPSWDADMKPLPLDHLPPHEDPKQKERWGNTSIVELKGEYSQFLLKKLAKVFPDAIPQHVLDSLKSTTRPSTRFVIEVPVPTAS